MLYLGEGAKALAYFAPPRVTNEIPLDTVVSYRKKVLEH
jgi:hypothetical protein